MKVHKIGEIDNYYGGLYVKKEDGRYFFGIENYNPTEWQEIRMSLYRELLSVEIHNNSFISNISLVDNVITLKKYTATLSDSTLMTIDTAIPLEYNGDIDLYTGEEIFNMYDLDDGHFKAWIEHDVYIEEIKEIT